MIGVQAAASLVLLVLAALLTRATISATKVDIGFDAQPLVTIAPAVRPGALRRREDAGVLGRRARAPARLPNVQAASLTLFPPYGGGQLRTNLKRNGVTYETYSHETLADYFSTHRSAHRPRPRLHPG